jgi:hypothetical protein
MRTGFIYWWPGRRVAGILLPFAVPLGPECGNTTQHHGSNIRETSRLHRHLPRGSKMLEHNIIPRWRDLRERSCSGIEAHLDSTKWKAIQPIKRETCGRCPLHRYRSTLGLTRGKTTEHCVRVTLNSSQSPRSRPTGSNLSILPSTV